MDGVLASRSTRNPSEHPPSVASLREATPPHGSAVGRCSPASTLFRDTPRMAPELPPPEPPPARLARAEFMRRFGRPPSSIAFAPGRVNLIGEHVDYAGGLVLPIAIDRGTAVAVGRTPTGRDSTIISLDQGEVSIDPLLAPLPLVAPAERWANYPLGMLALLREEGVAAPPLDLVAATDLPIGGGLSSSAALTVATAVAALGALGIDADDFGRMRLARGARLVEHRFAGVPCGLMDPAIVSLAREGQALLLDCRLDGADGSFRHVPLPRELAVLILDSGVRHRLDEGGYASRQQAVREAAAMLGVPTLRDLLDAASGNLDEALARLDSVPLDAIVRRRAHHVLAECDRVRRAVAILDSLSEPRSDDASLRSHRLGSLGRILVEGHASLRDDFGVSTPELDLLVEASLEAGALGARLTGAGFGGCVVVLMARSQDFPLTEDVVRRYADQFSGIFTWYSTTPRRGARVMTVS